MINFLTDLATLLNDAMHPDHLAAAKDYRRVEVRTWEYDSMVYIAIEGRTFFFRSLWAILAY